jgi:hypothetical protein
VKNRFPLSRKPFFEAAQAAKKGTAQRAGRYVTIVEIMRMAEFAGFLSLSPEECRRKLRQ